jgi:hypothetical protein
VSGFQDGLETTPPDVIRWPLEAAQVCCPGPYWLATVGLSHQVKGNGC